MFTISKRFDFSAAHQLSGLHEDHPCSRMHGHNYCVTFEFKSTALNSVGFVIDYRDLDTIKAWIDLVLDHRCINDVWPLMNPTAENIAKTLYSQFKDQFPELSAVMVEETEKTLAVYEEA